ncbi:DNA-binding protein [Parabacteroides sp. An277]|uniref:HU family DNA-binding protein n=1 Tax=Parabacteroides sp. An277 TaxID=1965619 RepID=UPI000B383FAD|nr:HU family DNA-binding protein [Parabacteroides sp. An277]OUO54597.1 DNA-binding protein [Parabacteroides sp. An277]
MNKTDFISQVAEKSGLTKADAKKAVDAFCETVTDVLKAGDKLALLGFGTFSVTEKPARTGLNPRTKEPIEIAARKVAKFKPGAELSEAVK